MNKKKMDIKKVLNIVYGVILVIVLLLAVFVIFANTEVVSGYSMYVVESGSMEPAIKTGSVIFVGESDEYEVDDVVTVQPAEQPAESYTHRIKEVNDDGEYVTKGDANDSEDATPVAKDQIIGKVLFTLPLIGYAVAFSKTQTGFILLVVVPAVLIIANEVGSIKTEVSKLIKDKKPSASAKRSSTSREKKDENKK